MRSARLILLVAAVALTGAALAGEAGKAASPGDAPMAVVNGEPITKAEFDRALSAYMRRFRQMTGGMHGMVKEPNEQMKAEVLQQLVDRMLLWQEARKNLPEDLDARVDRELEAIKGRFPDERSFQQALDAENLTMEALKGLIRQQLAVQNYVETQIQPGVKVSEEEVRRFYEENQDKFTSPEQVRASHILIRVAPSASEEEKDRARKRVAEIRERALKGEDFAELARKHSEDPGSATNGGDLGFFTRDRMVKPFADAAFALKAGEISDVVETRFGYHVIKVTDRKEATRHGFDDVKEQIQGYLEARALDRAIRAKVDELRKTAEIRMVSSHM